MEPDESFDEFLIHMNGVTRYIYKWYILNGNMKLERDLHGLITDQQSTCSFNRFDEAKSFNSKIPEGVFWNRCSFTKQNKCYVLLKLNPGNSKLLRSRTLRQPIMMCHLVRSKVRDLVGKVRRSDSPLLQSFSLLLFLHYRVAYTRI